MRNNRALFSMQRTVFTAVFWGGVFVFAALFLFLPPQNARAAFGISPPFMNIGTLVRGSRYVQTIFLVQDQPNQDLPILAKLDVPAAIRGWFTISPGERFAIPQGMRQFAATIEVKVPENADLGVYHGTLTFTTAPNEAGQVTIALGAQVDLNLVVGTDIVRKFSIALVKPQDIEEGWNPRVYVKANNEGNIAERFDGATLEIYDQFGAARLAYIQKKGAELPEIPSFTTQDFVLEFPTDFHLGMGQYWASIALLHEGTVVGSQRTVFTVLKRGSLSSPLEKVLQGVQDNWPYYAGGLAVILAAGATGAVRKKRRRGA